MMSKNKYYWVDEEGCEHLLSDMTTKLLHQVVGKLEHTVGTIEGVMWEADYTYVERATKQLKKTIKRMEKELERR